MTSFVRGLLGVLVQGFLYACTVVLVWTFANAWIHNGETLVKINEYGEAQAELVLIVAFTMIMLAHYIMSLKKEVKE